MSAHRERTGRRAWIASAPALLISVLLLGVPFLAALARSLAPLGSLDISAYLGLLDSSFLAVLWRSVKFALLVTLACLLLGLPTAYLLTRCGTVLRRLMLAAIGLSFLIGTLMRSYAWLAILGAHGLINSFYHGLGGDHPLRLAFTFGSMLIASVQVELPLFILPSYGVMRGIDPRLGQAARSLGGDGITGWFTVFLPLALPGLVASVVLVFLTSLTFYTTPALLGPPDTYLLSQELEVGINTLGDNAGASARIVVMLLFAAAAVAAWRLLQRGLSAKRAGRADGGRRFDAARERLARLAERLAATLSPVRRAPLWLCFWLAFALLLLPMVVILPLSISSDFYLRFPPRGFSLHWVKTYLGDPDLIEPTFFSLQIALPAALLSTAAGAAAALAVDRLSGIGRKIVIAAATAPLVVSPITVTASLYLLATHWTWIDPSVLFVSVYAVMGLPYGFVLVQAAAQRVDPRLGLAAATMAAPATVFRTIMLPLLAGALASACVFAGLLALDDINAGLFLSSSERMPLSVRLWEEMKMAITPLPAAITLLGLIAMGVAYAGWRALAAGLHRRASRAWRGQPDRAAGSER